MTRSLRTRIPPLAAALLALAAAPDALAAATTTTKVYGPAHPKIGRQVTVGARGFTTKRRVIEVTIHRHGKCRATFYGEENAGSFIAFSRFVGPGAYDESRRDISFRGKTNGHYCAYLGDPKKRTSDPPVARSSKHFQSVR